MKRNAKLAMVALLMVALGAGGLYALYSGYKKFRAEQLKEYRYGGTVGEAAEGTSLEAIRESLLTDEFLDHVIAKHNLPDVWKVDDAEAKSRIREKFRIFLDDTKVKVSYQDKSQEIAHEILMSIVRQYNKLVMEAKEQQSGVVPGQTDVLTD